MAIIPAVSELTASRLVGDKARQPAGPKTNAAKSKQAAKTEQFG
jgi:hypothetical protein